jgi:hypothetical protein
LRISETPTLLPVDPPPEVAAAELPAEVAAADEPAADEPAADEAVAEVAAADVPAADVAALVLPAAGVLLLEEQAARPAAAVTASATAPKR